MKSRLLHFQKSYLRTRRIGEKVVDILLFFSYTAVVNGQLYLLMAGRLQRVMLDFMLPLCNLPHLHIHLHSKLVLERNRDTRVILNSLINQTMSLFQQFCQRHCCD